MQIQQKLEQYVRGGLCHPFNFVQIGGFDGVTGDPIHSLVTSLNIPGVIAEPQPRPFAALSHTYRNHPNIVLKNAAVAWKAGEMTMYVIEPGHDEHPWVYQLASFRKEVVLHHCETLPAIAGWIQEVDIPCLTFRELLEAGAISQDIGLLQIDTEGFDADILEMALQECVRSFRNFPAIIHYEHFHLSDIQRQQTMTNLRHLNYDVTVGHMDTLAVRDDICSKQ